LRQTRRRCVSNNANERDFSKLQLVDRSLDKSNNTQPTITTKKERVVKPNNPIENPLYGTHKMTNAEKRARRIELRLARRDRRFEEKQNSKLMQQRIEEAEIEYLDNGWLLIDKKFFDLLSIIISFIVFNLI
jgi:enoyl reductase-like protein